MTAAVLGVLGVLLLGAAGRQALLASRRCEVRWRLGPSPTRAASTVAASVLPSLMARWQNRPAARRRHLIAELPPALDDVARALRAGASLRQAMADAARGGLAGSGGVAATELGTIVARADRGLALAAVLDEWAAEQPLIELRLAATALALAADAGGRAAQVVEAVAGTLRERHAAAEEVRVQSVQARLSAMVIALLPVGFTAWCVCTDRRAASFLLGSAAGWLCLLAGFGLLAVGAWWMARIIRSAA